MPLINNCPICGKETNNLVDSCITCENCGNFLKEDTIKEDIKTEEKVSKRSFKFYFKTILTTGFIIFLIMTINYIAELFQDSKISKGVFYIGLFIILAPMYFKIVYDKPNEEIYYGIRIIGILFLMISAFIFFKPTFFLI